ncbi:MAG: hypothetical protein IT462_09890 [Planctomycetes bacterium]|nr:hypothetical protein [Planctomycetota bacterium]
MQEDASKSNPAVAALLERLQQGGVPQKRKVIEEAVALGDDGVPVIEAGALSGVREIVNDSLIALLRNEGPGNEILFGWLRDGTLGVTRLATAFKELKFEGGPAFICECIDAGKFKEHQIAEAAEYLGDNPSPAVVRTLKACRLAYPSLSTMLDRALSKMTGVDASAADVPDQAREIKSQVDGSSRSGAPEKKGCMGAVLVALALLIALLAMAGCDDVKRKEFGGLIGVVGYPPISGAKIEIYEGPRWAGYDSTQGLVGTGVTDAGGRFQIPIGDAFLGRPLVVLARPQTGAEYLDFGSSGNPVRPFTGNRRPWAAMIRQFGGGEDTIAITPISTAAFEAFMRLPQDEVGGTGVRFDTKVVSECNTAAGNAFGVYADAAETMPAPPGGAPFVALGTLDAENNNFATGYTYALLQLAQAANDFVSQTTATTDTALDFYEAMFKDARDAVLDGLYFGAPIDFFTQAGAPDISGIEVDGSSEFIDFIADNALDNDDQLIAGAVRNNAFTPAPTDIVDGQEISTGSLRPMRFDRIDTLNYPFSGNVELTIEGAGFHHTDRFVFRGGVPNSEFAVDHTSVGVDGEIIERSSTRMRLRIPDFAATTKTVPNALTVPTGGDYTLLSFVLQHRPNDTLDAERVTEIILSADARVTRRTELLLLKAQIGRLEAGSVLRAATSGNNVFTAAQDPAALVPGTDDVYALRIRVVNPDVAAINDVGIDLSESEFTQLGAALVADVFGGAASNRAIVFESAADLTAKQQDLAPGEVGEFVYPFIFLDGEVALGAPVEFDIVMSGVSAGAGNPTVATNDVTVFAREVELAPVEPDATPELQSLTITMPATVSDGDEFEIEFAVMAAPRTGVPMRTLRVESVDVTIDFDGETFTLHLGDNFFDEPGPSGLHAKSLTLLSDGGRAMPALLTQAAPGDSIILTIQTTSGVTDTLTVTATATARDTATLAPSSASDSDSTTVS